MFTDEELDRLANDALRMAGDAELPEEVRRQAKSLADEAYRMKTVMAVHAERLHEIEENRRLGL